MSSLASEMLRDSRRRLRLWQAAALILGLLLWRERLR